jgi:hypothetical protein
MLYMLNARRGYCTISRGGESTGFPSFAGDPYVQSGLRIAARGGNGARVVPGSGRHAQNNAGERKHDLTTIIFERPRLREDGSFATSGDASAAADNGALHTLTALDSNGKPQAALARAPTRESEVNKSNVLDPSESVVKDFGVRILPHAQVRSFPTCA